MRTWQYGLRIKTHDLRLISEASGQVRLVASPPKMTLIMAGLLARESMRLLISMRIMAVMSTSVVVVVMRPTKRRRRLAKTPPSRTSTFVGFTVEGFPRNGIQTRWVEGFEFIQNESANNLNNGIYPTLSANGLVQNNVSYGSLDTAMWVAGSENVRVIGNEVYDSVIGFEITVSNNVWVTQNKIHNNTLGIGLFHPDGAGTRRSSSWPTG